MTLQLYVSILFSQCFSRRVLTSNVLGLVHKYNRPGFHTSARNLEQDEMIMFLVLLFNYLH